MGNLIFYRHDPQITKSASSIKPNNQVIILVAVIILLLVGAAVYLYSIDQASGGHSILGLATSFIAFVAGRATGEKNGLSQNL